MSRRLIVVGAGGFAREVLDVVDAIGKATPSEAWQVAGYLDDGPSAENAARMEGRGICYLGPITKADTTMADWFVVGIGSPSARARIVEQLEAAGLTSATLIHPTATWGHDVRFGDGTVVCAGVRLTTNINVGRHVHLNLNATVGHDSVIGDFVSVNPLVSISGDCTIHDGVLLGVGCVILNKVSVGAGATVGGSACVVRDVPPAIVVKGVPAR